VTIKAAGLDHLVLRVKDPEVMERFYVEVMGLAVERRQPQVGLVQLRAGAHLIDLLDAGGLVGREGGAAPTAAGRNLDHFCLNIEDFDLARVTEHLRSHGVAVGQSGRRFGSKGFGVSVYLADPEGNTVELRG